MIEWIVSSSALILLIIAIRFLFRNRLALRMRYALWLLVVLRLLVPVSFFTSSFSILNLLELGRTTTGADIRMPQTAGADAMQPIRAEEEGEQVSGPIAVGTETLQPEQTAAMGADVPQLKQPDEIKRTKGSGGGFQGGYLSGDGESADGAVGRDKAGRILFGIWLSGFLMCTGIAAVGNDCYRRQLYRSRKPWKPPAESRLPVYLSPVVSTPCLFGLVHPAIYLTPGAVSLQNQHFGTGNHEKRGSAARKEREALGYVLNHENIHYRHHDNLWVLVRAACICIHWYNPLVWLASRLSRQDCELACDEEVMESLGEKERVAYGRALLAFSVQDNGVLESLQYATTISGGKKQLKERLMIIVQKPERSHAALVWTLLLALLVSMMTFTGQNGKMDAQAWDEIQEEKQASDRTGTEVGNNNAYGEGPGREEVYTKEVPFDLGDGGNYVLQVNGRTISGTGEYQTDSITFCLVYDGGQEVLQTIQPGDAKVLYTRPVRAVEPFSDAEEEWPWIFSSDREVFFAKSLQTLEDLPAAAAWAFENESREEMWAYAPDGGILAADLNFDGYNDFCLQAGIGSVNVPYYCYLWNPAEGRFEPGCMIPNVKVNEETRLIESLTKDGEGLYSIKYYRFDEENVLHLVRYVEENQWEDAVFPFLDLTYCEDGYYTLPAVDDWDYLTEYGGALAERLVYWAKQALTELYEWSGTKIDTACFFTNSFGDFFFANSLEDAKADRTFYTRAYGGRAGFFDCIESMYVVTERTSWYSKVTLWNMPEDIQDMSDLELAEWYFEHAPLTKGERAAEIGESYEDTYTVRTESGNYYELTLNPTTREIGSIYGPYDSYPIH